MEASTTSLLTVLGSGLFAAVISGSVSRLNAERDILVSHITKERKSWRDKVRDKSTAVFDAYSEKNVIQLKKLKAEFQLILNPIDQDDREIVNHFTSLIETCGDGGDAAIDAFMVKVSLLLKHDWDRAKIEADSLGNMGRSADRMSLAVYQDKISKT